MYLEIWFLKKNISEYIIYLINNIVNFLDEEVAEAKLVITKISRLI